MSSETAYQFGLALSPVAMIRLCQQAKPSKGNNMKVRQSVVEIVKPVLVSTVTLELVDKDIADFRTMLDGASKGILKAADVEFMRSIYSAIFPGEVPAGITHKSLVERARSMPEVSDALDASKYVLAIRELRNSVPACGLKQAKDAIDVLRDERNLADLRERMTGN